MIGVSYATPAPDYNKIKGLTFGTTTSEDSTKTRDSWGPVELTASIVIMACIIGAYVYFSG